MDSATKPARAWMAIGTVSRLEALRILTQYDSSDMHHNGDTSSRCHWSVFILTRIFSPQFPDFQEAVETVPGYPLSAPLPPPLPSGSDENYLPDLFNPEEMAKDLGINAYYIKMLSIWGKLSLYLHEIRRGKVEAPWSPDSTYTRLNIEVYECEAQLTQQHLFRNAAFSKRSLAELAEQQQYWNPWIAMQFIAHASPALLNHPFIHLVVMRGNHGIPQSRHFLQQIVDQALFHSGWVFRFVQACEDLPFVINDPMIGHLVAATATIPWIFQFASDTKVSKKATEDLGKCERFLSRMATTWPHISQKVHHPASPTQNRPHPYK